MGDMDCLSEEQLAAYAAGDGDPAETERTRAHVKECSRCRDRVESHKFDAGFLADVRAAGREESKSDSDLSSAETVDNENSQDRTSFPSIPGYRIRREVGRGGMGVVFEAIQTKLNRTVALKVLPPMLAKISTTAIKRFRAEASAAARLHHNNIIPVYDFGESEGAYYYAMELIDGEPLHRVIRSLALGESLAALPTQLTEFLPKKSINRDDAAGGATENDSNACPDDDGSTPSSSTATSAAYYRQVARWMRDVADALHHAHGKGIIHRDIKPANLMLASDGRIMVADFGLAKSTDTESVTMTGSLVGTWRYMSPEQALAKRMPVDHRTDIYSLAATMYELLTFRPAFPGSDEKEIISKLIIEEPVRPRKIIRSVPAELETICLKAMEKSRDRRYATAAAFADEFRRYLNDLPIVARPPGPIVRVRKFARRHRGFASILMATVILLAASTVWFYTLHVEQQRKRLRIETAVEQGNNFLDQAKLQAAEEHFVLARSLDPNNVEAIGNLARVKKETYNSMPDPDPSLLEEANTFCDIALGLDTQRTRYPLLLNTKGVVLKMLGRYPGAIKIYEQAHNLEEANLSPVINLGTIHALKNDLLESSRWFQRAERMLPDPMANTPACVPLHLNLGALLLYQSDAAANEHLTTAHRCQRGHVPTLTLLARACLASGACDRTRDAVYFAEVADYIADAKRPTTKRVLALAYFRKDALDDAVREAIAAIGLEDLKTPNYLILALAHARLGDYRTARSDLAQARNSWPSKLDKPGEFIAKAPGGFLWFESADELLALRAEVETLLDGAGR